MLAEGQLVGTKRDRLGRVAEKVPAGPLDEPAAREQNSVRLGGDDERSLRLAGKCFEQRELVLGRLGPMEVGPIGKTPACRFGSQADIERGDGPAGGAGGEILQHGPQHGQTLWGQRTSPQFARVGS